MKTKTNVKAGGNTCVRLSLDKEMVNPVLRLRCRRPHTGFFGKTCPSFYRYSALRVRRKKGH